jgi:hypothetical protein
MLITKETNKLDGSICYLAAHTSNRGVRVLAEGETRSEAITGLYELVLTRQAELSRTR